MRILIVTPAPRGSRKGNRVTADRYAGLLRALGHRVLVAEDYDGRPYDALVALHARKSHSAIRRFRAARPHSPIVVVLTGTDLYRDLPNSRRACESLAWSTRLVLLQSDGVTYLPAEFRAKARVIVQSCPRSLVKPRPLVNTFEVSVLGHLRTVKDPFRAALAARRLPDDSLVRIVQLGGALSASMERRARAEVHRNPRYRWLGDVPRAKALKLLARSRLTVVSSKLEGGSNAIVEALAAGTPVLASRVSGNVGLLGDGYPGYFALGDTTALAKLLARAERDERFYAEICRACRKLAPMVEPRRELSAWRALLGDLWPSRGIVAGSVR